MRGESHFYSSELMNLHEAAVPASALETLTFRECFHRTPTSNLTDSAEKWKSLTH